MERTVVENKEQAFRQICDEYMKGDVVLGELLSSIEIIGISVMDVVDVYKNLRQKIDGWNFIEIDEEGRIVP